MALPLREGGSAPTSDRHGNMALWTRWRLARPYAGALLALLLSELITPSTAQAAGCGRYVHFQADGLGAAGLDQLGIPADLAVEHAPPAVPGLKAPCSGPM